VSPPVVPRVVAAVLAFVLLSAGDCGSLSYSQIVTGHSARIIASNDSGETVFVLLYADDVSNSGGQWYPGAVTGITTHIDGTYHLVVPGSDLQLGNYASSVNLLREATEDMYKKRNEGQGADTTEALERTRTARQNLDGLFQPELTLASCTGTVTFPTEFSENQKPIEIGATVTKSSAGQWGAACPDST